jgi:hypothetical protein
VSIGNSSSYSVSAVNGATSYQWTVPTGVTITSGQGTSAVNLMFGSNFVGGNVNVRAVNACGISANASSKYVNVSAPAPSQIFGPQVVCSIMGTPTTATYSVTAVGGATQYTWVRPNGMNIISGQGTNVLTVTFNSTFISGSLSCQTISPCGSSPMTYYTISAAPQTTNPISGIANVCSIQGTSNTAVYTTTAISGVSSYVWSVSDPTNMNIVSGQSSTSLSLSFTSGFTSGTVSVVATSSCGNSPIVRTFTVTGCAPAPIVVSSGAGTETKSDLRIVETSLRNASCYGTATGEARLAVSGGVAPYIYEVNGKKVNSVSQLTELMAGEYTVRVMDMNGDVAMSKFTIDQPDRLEIRALVIKHPSSLDANDGEGIISARGGVGQYSYTWVGGNIEETQYSTSLVSGTYTVSVKDENGCEEKSEIEFLLDEKQISENNHSELDLKAYPVPATDELTIELTEPLDHHYMVRVITLDGSIVFDELLLAYSSAKMTLNCSNWAQGTYFIQVYDTEGNRIKVKEIVIQH